MVISSTIPVMVVEGDIGHVPPASDQECKLITMFGHGQVQECVDGQIIQEPTMLQRGIRLFLRIGLALPRVLPEM